MSKNVSCSSSFIAEELNYLVYTFPVDGLFPIAPAYENVGVVACHRLQMVEKLDYLCGKMGKVRPLYLHSFRWYFPNPFI